MNRINISSSNIRSIGYDAENLVLEVEFKTTGVYQYFDVSENVYQSLMAASSHGSFFNAQIKQNYRNSKIS